MRRPRLLALLSVALVAGACSGNATAVQDPMAALTAEQRVVADQVTGALLGGAPLPMTATEDNMRCVAAKLVVTFGADQIRALGLDDAQSFGGAQITASDADTIADYITQCVDLRHAIVTELTASAEIGETSSKCLGDTIKDSELISIVSSALQPSDQAADGLAADVLGRLNDAIPQCLTASEQAKLAGA